MSSGFIITAAGHELSLAKPLPIHVGDVYSIAHSLSCINRYTGHAKRPYSVAEHSLLVCDIAEREFGLPPRGLLAAQLHDMHETVATDMHTPGKRHIGEAWRVWETRWAHIFQAAHRTMQASLEFEHQIKMADLIALATERRDLVPPAPTPWSVLAGIEPVGWVRLDSPERNERPWHWWRDRFVERHNELREAMKWI
jgi:uncharacterized protein